MRLTPIENPARPILKAAYFISKKQFGKVIAPLRYIYARSIPALKTSLRIYRSEKSLKLPKQTRLLIRYYTSHLNDCPFCSDISGFMAEKEKVELQRWKEFMNFRDSNQFSAKEKSLLAYLEEINMTKTASNETFARLRSYYSDTEIVEITWLNATENYFNLMAKPLGLHSDDLEMTRASHGYDPAPYRV